MIFPTTEWSVLTSISRLGTKPYKAFSSLESANNLISMFVFFFNFVRPHSALNGLTPAQVAGLNLSKRRKREFAELVK